LKLTPSELETDTIRIAPPAPPSSRRNVLLSEDQRWYLKRTFVISPETRWK